EHSCSLKSPSVSPPKEHSCSLNSPSVSPPKEHSCSLKSPSVSPPQEHSCSLKSPSVSPPQEHSCSLKSPSVSPPQEHSCSLKSPSVSPPQKHSCSLKRTFVVNVTQTSYQAEENQNITLEWTFGTRTDTSLSSISTLCKLFTETRPYVLFHLHRGVESPESQDPEFAGRVQWDKDVLTEGRLTLHVSRLRTNDSGFIPDGSNSRRCWLNVTAAEELEPQRPTESPQPENLRGVWVTFGLLAALVVVFNVSNACITLIRYKRRTHNAAIHTGSSSEKQTIRTYISPSESEHKVRLSNI
ncbi:hypothetical protein F7725_010646, partial [Dissostichus mawsoni]